MLTVKRCHPIQIIAIGCDADQFVMTGAISEGQVVAQAWTLLLGGLGVAYTLDRFNTFPSYLLPTLASIDISSGLTRSQGNGSGCLACHIALQLPASFLSHLAAGLNE